jgi:acyl CoA:acetate/3-ketoacid CoA transferase alpha subunit/acyl CoA:acetate/3-ketoacid CoA transferase beta subunit
MTTEDLAGGTASALDELRRRYPLRSEKPGTSKVVPLQEAIRDWVRPGDAVHLAYSDARPNAAVMEIIRRFDGTDPGLTLSTSGLVSVQHALISRGLLRKVMTSFAGENYPAPRPSPIFQRAVRDGRVEVENWSLYTLVARLKAGALGIPFFPVHSIGGSSLEQEHLGQDFARLTDPFDGGEVGVVRAYRPDVTIVQGVAADRAGNVVMAAPFGESMWGSLAAKRGVIACVERIVPTEALRLQSHMVKIPAHCVRAVCEVPFGSHPYGLFNPGFGSVPSYVEDHGFLVEGQDAADVSAEAFEDWIDEWVLAVGDHEGYLRKLGTSRLAKLRGDAVPGSWELESLQLETSASDPSAAERLVTAAADELSAAVARSGHDVILAGVGYSNLAAWLALHEMESVGTPVDVMAEIGMFGYSPRPGEPFIFSLRNFLTCSILTDVDAVLGTFVSGPGTGALGALGAAQIDRAGNVNSTWSEKGDFLVGSGGANDIASAAQEVIVMLKHAPNRLVEKVDYITSPGEKVSTIVTTEGVLRRQGGDFVLTAVHRLDGSSLADAVARVRSRTGWDLQVSDDVAFVPDPDPARLEVLRGFDPHRTFLR